MDRATECRVIESAVAEMRRQQVPVTPRGVERVVTNCQKASKQTVGQKLTEIQRQLDTTIAAVSKVIPKEPPLAEMAERIVREHPDVLLHVNEERGTMHAYLEPVTNGVPGRYDDREVGQPYPLGHARRSELEARLGALELIARDPHSSIHAKKRAEEGARSIRKLLKTLRPAPIAQKEIGKDRPGSGGL